MSLHTLANHLQSAGRGEDKQLVHMTPGEVEGLQAIAMAHGGSLTINPETGLPEAGFLSSILPMIAGFALGPAGMGLTAMQAGLASTALGTVLTGDLKKGVMAGLGAYGGAGLGQGLMAQGTAAVPTTTPAVSASVPTQVQSTAGDIFAQGGRFGNIGAVDITANPLQGGMTGYPTGVPSVSPTAPGPISATLNQTPLYPQVNFATGMPPPTPPVTTYTTQIGEPYRSIEITEAPIREAYGPLNPPPGFDPGKVNPKETIGSFRWENGRIVDPRNIHGVPYDPTAPSAAVSGYSPSTATTSQPFKGGMSPQYAGPSNAVNTTGQSISRPFSDRMAQLGQGAKTSFSSTEGLKGLYNAMPDYSVAAGLGSTAMSYSDEKRKEAEEAMRDAANKSPSLIRPYEFTYGATGADREPYTGSAERTYFAPQYTALTPYKAPGPEYAAEGGLMGYQAGGQIERMAAQNAMGANTGYPMASLQTPMYSNPETQRPEATNVIAPSADVGVGTYSGEPRFAEGGETTGGYSYSYNPATQQFTQTNTPQPVASRPSPVAPGGGPAFMGPIGSGYIGAGTYNKNARLNPSDSSTSAALPKYNFDPNTMQFTQVGGENKVSGGIAAPAMPSVVQPQSPAQPLIPNINIPAYQTPEQQLGLGGFYDYMNQQLGGMGGYSGYARGGNVGGGISHLGDYSDGGRLLKGPGDGVSDSIPASIGNRQPARLADGEFVVPARIVSEIGNGSTEAGARKLYAMMDRVQKARRKTVGKNQVARNTKAEKLLPA